MAQIVWRGESYEVIDPLDWVRPEAAFVKKVTGLTVAEVATNSVRSDPDAICAFIYVAKKRAGEKVRWADFDDFTLNEVDFVFDDDEREDDGDEDEPPGDEEGGEDPTPPSPTGTTRTGGSSTTSTRSRSTSTSTRGKQTS